MKPLLVLTIFALTINAQQKTRPPTFRNEPIDLASQSLISGFQGSDARLIFSRLEEQSKTRSKGEFETSASYSARLGSMGTAPLFGRLSISSPIGFVTGHGRLGRVETEYDADAGAMHVTLRTIGDGITWSDSTLAHYFYVGQNGFGAKRRVEHYTQEFIALEISNGDAVGLVEVPNRDVPSMTDSAISITVPMDLRDARQVKGSLRMLLICRLVEPFIKNETGFVEATFNNPYEEKHINKGLIIKILEIWLFDQATGRVYSKKVIDSR
jgi:hypothetical protein